MMIRIHDVVAIFNEDGTVTVDLVQRIRLGDASLSCTSVTSETQRIVDVFVHGKWYSLGEVCPYDEPIWGYGETEMHTPIDDIKRRKG